MIFSYALVPVLLWPLSLVSRIELRKSRIPPDYQRKEMIYTSVGSRSDSCGNAMAELINDLYRTKTI